MENAGAAAVRRLLTKFENISSKNILIFVGLGNNGGDGAQLCVCGFGVFWNTWKKIIKMYENLVEFVTPAAVLS